MTRPAEAAADVELLAEVRAGLGAAQKRLPSKYFYDRRGSALFETITRLPEYYLTRAERAVLREWMPELLAALAPCTLVELGAGAAEKTRLLLDAMRRDGVPGTYVPIDVSAEFLAAAAERLRADYPGLVVLPVVADVAVSLGLPAGVEHPVLFAFLGSTIGNFQPVEAVRLLRRVHGAMRPGDRLLLGADLRKDPARLLAAYDDAQGVTADFNRNILRVLNDRLGSDFRPERFAHRAVWNEAHQRIEMHLVSEGVQLVTVPGLGVVRFADGESVRTEISCKYDRAAIESLFADAGLALEAWRTDGEALFAVAVGAPR